MCDPIYWATILIGDGIEANAAYDDDFLSGGADNDRLWGAGGNDYLEGGTGKDIKAHAENDIFYREAA